ncbi:hypothetical protein [Chamaesiphon sp. VAR_48_metabat_135_sub]|uniref:hypothetical protein n=1 Tax=Chamaesiphon sp. VAR_48_metabat_135_sub TaxID=2964699 RepID=UPI00286BF3F2|nr:hypothetical protein [Chamaesiphon sp. VAR_48_metabat_135_sub]
MNLKSFLSLGFGIITLSCALPAFADIPTAPDQLNPMSPAPEQPGRDRSKLKVSADNDSAYFNGNNKIDPKTSKINLPNRRAILHKQPKTPGILNQPATDAIVSPGNYTSGPIKNNVNRNPRQTPTISNQPATETIVSPGNYTSGPIKNKVNSNPRHQ